MILQSKTSLAIMDASVICRPFINALRWSEISEDTTLLSLSARVFTKSLLTLPIRLIGLKSFSSRAPFFFGLRAMKVALQDLTTWQFWWKKVRTSIMSDFIKLHDFWKKAIVKPSRLGVLSGAQDLRASNASCSLKGASSSSFCSAQIVERPSKNSQGSPSFFFFVQLLIEFLDSFLYQLFVLN